PEIGDGYPAVQPVELLLQARIQALVGFSSQGRIANGRIAESEYRRQLKPGCPGGTQRGLTAEEPQVQPGACSRMRFKSGTLINAGAKAGSQPGDVVNNFSGGFE